MKKGRKRTKLQKRGQFVVLGSGSTRREAESDMESIRAEAEARGFSGLRVTKWGRGWEVWARQPARLKRKGKARGRRGKKRGNPAQHAVRRRGAKITIPTSARDWELYTKMPGVGKAAAALTKALKRELSRLHDDYISELTARGFDIGSGREPGEEMSKKAMATVLGRAFARLSPVMTEYRQFGAVDTEPRVNARQAFIDAGKSILGMEGYYLPELDDQMM